MQDNTIIDRLFSSFSELETAIESAKVTLARKTTVPVEIMARLQSYDQILVKQRTLAIELKDFMVKGEWDQVSRQVGLINGLSAMIRDDARSILLALTPEASKTVEDEIGNFC